MKIHKINKLCFINNNKLTNTQLHYTIKILYIFKTFITYKKQNNKTQNAYPTISKIHHNQFDDNPIHRHILPLRQIHTINKQLIRRINVTNNKIWRSNYRR